MNSSSSSLQSRSLSYLPVLLCLVALAAVVLMIDLKGISTDEGIRLGIVNGGRPFVAGPTLPPPSSGEVLETISPYAYQPAYYLFLNSLMRVFERHELNFFRSVNVVFFALCLFGILRLSARWALWPRVFLVTLFAFNAYLIMHVLQIREYVVALAFYIWSTQLILKLDQRVLGDEWRDVAWFIAYGLLLSAGFYLQTWVVFPAIAQGAFLVLRRRPQFWRFTAHLAVCYLLVLSLTWPYLQSHAQKVNVGLWEREQVTLSGQLFQGFSLVLSGHVPRHSLLMTLLPWAWIGMLGAGVVVLVRTRRLLPSAFVAESSRLVWLMGLSIVIPLAFQIAYFFKVEPLSVWPRYFIVHYFPLTFLVALAFRTIHESRPVVSRRQPITAMLIAASLLVAGSSVAQVRSYWRDPYFDTSTSPASNWPTIAAALRDVLRPGDVVFTRDFIVRSTLTATYPLPHRTPLLPELDSCNLEGVPRVLYLEASHSLAERPDLTARLKARGFSVMQEWPIPAGDGSGPLKDWCILTFSRP